MLIIIAFDIIFQSGEFAGAERSAWVDLGINIIGGAVGAAVGIAGTIWIFNKTIKQNYLDDKNKKAQHREENLLYFKTLLSSIITDIDNQLSLYKSFSSELRSSPKEFPSIKLLSLEDLSYIADRLNQEDLFHAYRSKFPTNDAVVEIKQIINDIIYFNRKHNTLISDIDKSKQFDYQRKKEFQEMYESIFELAGQVSSKTISMSDDVSDPLIILTKYYLDVKSSDILDTKEYYENFVKPLMDKLLPIIGNRTATDLIFRLKRLQTIYRDIDFQNNNLANVVDLAGEHMTNVLSKLKTRSTKLLSLNLVENIGEKN